MTEKRYCAYAYVDPRAPFEVELLGVPFDREPYHVGHGEVGRMLAKIKAVTNKPAYVYGNKTNDRTWEIIAAGARPHAVPLEFSPDPSVAELAAGEAKEELAAAHRRQAAPVTSGVPLMSLTNTVAVGISESSGSTASAGALYQSARRQAIAGAIPATQVGSSWLVSDSDLSGVISKVWKSATPEEVQKTAARALEAKRVSVNDFSLLKGK